MMFVEMKSEEMTWKYPKYSAKVDAWIVQQWRAGWMDKTSNNAKQTTCPPFQFLVSSRK